MALTLTLKPGEFLIVNGCVIRNTQKRQTLRIENRADIIRGNDILKEAEADTPTKRVVYMIQQALVCFEMRDKLDKKILADLAQLACLFNSRIRDTVCEAANHVSHSDYYRAYVALKPVLEHETRLFDLAAAPATAPRSGDGAQQVLAG
jgi:flagellar protein FlbT